MTKHFGFAGDSVTVPSRLNAWSVGQGYAALICQRAGAVEHNVAVSGANMSAIASQLPTLLAITPALDALSINGFENDVGVIPIATAKSQLDNMVASAIAGGISANKITLWTPFIYENAAYLAAVPPFLQTVRDIGLKYGVCVIDIFSRFSEFSKTRSDYSSLRNVDGHPTVAGHIEFANMLSLAQGANSAMYQNPPLPPSGQPHSAIFNGTNQTIYLNDITPSDFTKLAICLFVKLGSNNQMGIFGSRSRTDYGEGLYINSTGHLVYTRTYSNITTTFTTDLSISADNNWHCIKFAGDASLPLASKVQIDIDGVPANLTISGSGNSFTFFIMNDGGGYGPYFGIEASAIGSHPFIGQMAYINFIDGQSQMPSSAFIQNGHPVLYSGAYGIAGSWLTLFNPASVVTLGYDDHGGLAGSHSGTNDWILNNLTISDMSIDIPN